MSYADAYVAAGDGLSDDTGGDTSESNAAWAEAGSSSTVLAAARYFIAMDDEGAYGHLYSCSSIVTT